MAASENRSSPRVAPRSVTRAMATSSMISSMVVARGLDAAGEGQVAHGAEPDGALLDDLAVAARVVLALGEQHAVALEHAALVGEVDRRDLDALAADVVPDVQLGPVGDREDPHVLALVDPAVVEAPQLGALHLRVPLAELVAVGVDALLGAGLLLVATAAAEGGGEAVLLDGVEQGADLVAGCGWSCRRRRRCRWRSPPRRGATIRRTPSRLTQLSRVASTSGKS